MGIINSAATLLHIVVTLVLINSCMIMAVATEMDQARAQDS